MASPWDDIEVARQQRELVDRQINGTWPQHFRAFAAAVRDTQCPGEIIEVGCASGYGREILDRAGVQYRSYSGTDVSRPAIAMARTLYPESRWTDELELQPRSADVVIDGCALMHAEGWEKHLEQLCAASRRWVILHRVPVATETKRTATHGYGREFPAWTFDERDLDASMAYQGLIHAQTIAADGESQTLVYARPRHYATYADSGYLPQLRALYRSMERHCGPFELHVLAWDDEVERECDQRASVWMTNVRDWLAEHPECGRDKLPGPERTRAEHMWTVGPRFVADVMREPYADAVTYVDADVMFHSSPEPVFAEIGGARVAVVPHGFARAHQGLPGPTVESHSIFGRYNVGMVYVAEQSVAADWAVQCRDWCYDKVEANRYGDQRYLDEWPWRMGAHVVQHPGACLGPWAIHTRSLQLHGDTVMFGGQPLVSYHYSAFRLVQEGGVQITRPEYRVTPRQEEIIYRPYIREIQKP